MALFSGLLKLDSLTCPTLLDTLKRRKVTSRGRSKTPMNKTVVEQPPAVPSLPILEEESIEEGPIEASVFSHQLEDTFIPFASSSNALPDALPTRVEVDFSTFSKEVLHEGLERPQVEAVLDQVLSAPEFTHSLEAFKRAAKEDASKLEMDPEQAFADMLNVILATAREIDPELDYEHDIYYTVRDDAAVRAERWKRDPPVEPVVEKKPSTEPVLSEMEIYELKYKEYLAQLEVRENPRPSLMTRDDPRFDLNTVEKPRHPDEENSEYSYYSDSEGEEEGEAAEKAADGAGETGQCAPFFERSNSVLTYSLQPAQ